MNINFIYCYNLDNSIQILFENKNISKIKNYLSTKT